MKILSWNVNGLRSVAKKGFVEWLQKSEAEIICLQEIKAQENQLDFWLRFVPGYSLYVSSAKKKGYSGVAVYTKNKPLSVKRKISFTQFDNEGRFLKLEYPEFVLINIYLPHGQRDQGKLPYKLKAYQYLFKSLKNLKGKKVVLVGDFNIAHTELDLARPQDNRNNTMFTREERTQLDQLIKLGFIDTFRQFRKKGGHYTWWPWRLNARERNLGWRIDYVFVSKNLASELKNVFIFNNVTGSDHCPIGVEMSS